MNSREYYMLKKELDDIKDLLLKVIEKQEKIELNGEIEFGDPYNVGRNKKHINVSLRKVEENDP